MKNLLLILGLLFSHCLFAQKTDENNDRTLPDSVRQQLIDHLYKKEKRLFSNPTRNDFQTPDVLNPINFTTIRERLPAQNGKAKSIKLPNRASISYIKPGSNIHLVFDTLFMRLLSEHDMLGLRVIAVIRRKDESIKPLSVSGLTSVNPGDNTTKEELLSESQRQFSTSLKEKKEGTEDTVDVKDNYTVRYYKSDKHTISAEINLAYENISDDDEIIITIENAIRHGLSYTVRLIFYDNSWKITPTGGFTFIRTLNTNDNNFHAGGSTGVAFQYHPKPSSSFWARFINPSFGPEINVLQDTDAKTIVGLGGFITNCMNTVKLGFGWNLNDGNNAPYISIGLDFIESFNTIKAVAEKAN